MVTNEEITQEAIKFIQDKEKNDPNNKFNDVVSELGHDYDVIIDEPLLESIESKAKKGEKYVPQLEEFIHKNCLQNNYIIDSLINRLSKNTGNGKRLILQEFSRARKKINQSKEVKKIFHQCTYSELKEVIFKWLSIEDEIWLNAILSCCIGNSVKGEPLWLFIIGVPSSTKTEILMGLRDSNKFFFLSDLSENSLVSGFVKLDGTPVEQLATQLDGKTLVIKDFTLILSLPKDKRTTILGQLRDFYDGYHDKKYGNSDKKISIKSKFGLIAAVTPKIDSFYAVMGQLGERFLKIRSDPDPHKMLEKAYENEGKEDEMRQEIQEAMSGFIEYLPIVEVNLENPFIEREIKRASIFIANGRTPLMSYKKSDQLFIEEIPQPEKPARVYKQLKKFVRNSCIVESKLEPDEFQLQVLWRVARDSVPPDRMKVLQVLYDKGLCNVKTIEGCSKLSKASVYRIIDLFEKLEMVICPKNDNDEGLYSLKKEYYPYPPLNSILLNSQRNSYPILYSYNLNDNNTNLSLEGAKPQNLDNKDIEVKGEEKGDFEKNRVYGQATSLRIPKEETFEWGKLESPVGEMCFYCKTLNPIYHTLNKNPICHNCCNQYKEGLEYEQNYQSGQ